MQAEKDHQVLIKQYRDARDRRRLRGQRLLARDHADQGRRQARHPERQARCRGARRDQPEGRPEHDQDAADEHRDLLADDHDQQHRQDGGAQRCHRHRQWRHGEDQLRDWTCHGFASAPRARCSRPSRPPARSSRRKPTNEHPLAFLARLAQGPAPARGDRLLRLRAAAPRGGLVGSAGAARDADGRARRRTQALARRRGLGARSPRRRRAGLRSRWPMSGRHRAAGHLGRLGCRLFGRQHGGDPCRALPARPDREDGTHRGSDRAARLAGPGAARPHCATASKHAFVWPMTMAARPT